MRLLVTTPLSVVVDEDAVSCVRADDTTGAFGILPGHADFLTVLTVTVITWRNAAGEEHHVAVRGGVLTVRHGNLVEIATRDAVSEDTLLRLGDAVLERFHEEEQSEEQSRVAAVRLHLAALRQLQRYLDSGQRVFPQAGASGPGASLGLDAREER